MNEEKPISPEDEINKVMDCVKSDSLTSQEKQTLSSLLGNKEIISKLLSKHKVWIANKVLRGEVSREYMLWAVDAYRAIFNRNASK